MAGCAIVRPPAATVESVRLVGASDEGARYLVTVHLTNPNDVDLPLRKAQLSLRVAEVGSYAFDAIPNHTLPANGEQTVTLGAAMPTELGADAVGNYSVNGHLTYQPPGEIAKLFTDAGFPRPRANFDASGDVQADLAPDMP
jgi:hypothetical protein